MICKFQTDMSTGQFGWRTEKIQPKISTWSPTEQINQCEGLHRTATRTIYHVSTSKCHWDYPLCIYLKLLLVLTYIYLLTMYLRRTVTRTIHHVSTSNYYCDYRLCIYIKLSLVLTCICLLTCTGGRQAGHQRCNKV
jgi:hypothetical protein